jgi:hypothetical protein
VVRHVVLFRFNPDAKEADKQSLRAGLTELGGAVPEIRRYEFGDDLGLADGNFDFAVVAEFASPSDFDTYAAHPLHQRLITELVRPILAQRVALLYEM